MYAILPQNPPNPTWSKSTFVTGFEFPSLNGLQEINQAGLEIASRVQIVSVPRPFLNSGPLSRAIQPVPRGSRGDHRFFEKHAAGGLSEVVLGRPPNSRTLIRRPIHQ